MSRRRSILLAALAGLLLPPVLLVLLWNLRSTGLTPQGVGMERLSIDLGPLPRSSTGLGVVTGRVLDDAGKPLPETEVVAAGATFLAATRTDTEGRFAIEGIPRSIDSLAAMAAHHEVSRIEEVDPADEPIELVLAGRPAVRPLRDPEPPPPPGRLGGRCVRSDGGPLGSLRVLALPLDAQGTEIAPHSSAPVDPRGFFEFGSLPSGLFHLVVLPAQREQDSRLRLSTVRAEVTPGDTKLVDIGFAAGSVAGVVQDATGQPVPGAVLRFTVRREGEEPIDAGVVRTGEGGVFRLADLPECTLEIEAIAPGLARGRAFVETSLGIVRQLIVPLE